MRTCSSPGCAEPAVATLTYDYTEATAVLGPLAVEANPHAYDLCQRHADRFSVPQGWQVIRLQAEFAPAQPSDDDLEALANAVREASKSPRPRPRSQAPGGPSRNLVTPEPERHLYVVRDTEDS